MSTILVAGLTNIETTLRVDGFPIAYEPTRYPFNGISSTVAGVGYNISKALTALGDSVRFLTLIGRDASYPMVLEALARDALAREYVLPLVAETAKSIIAYDADGRRAIFVDLKDIQERRYPAEQFETALRGSALAVLCNINFTRPLLERARRAGVPVATDVHTIASLDDPYNRDYLAAADILFMSDERLPAPPETWARRVLDRFGPAVVVIGMGAQGALLAVRDDNFIERVPAVSVRPVVSTIGAGDALFSAFVHAYVSAGDPYSAIRQAVAFAAHKIGATGAADGFLDAAALSALCRQLYG
ncbi:MAG: phosphofructokinase [Chloroflexota bacterium]|nr:MAG: phosphofructokinase [Chloroflexota bacterium]